MANLKGIIDSIRKIMWQDTGLNGDAQRIEQLGWMLFLKIFSDKDKELEVLNDEYVSPIPDELHWEAWAGDDEGMTGDELQQFVDQKLFPTLKNLKVGMSDDLANKRALIVREVFEGNNNYMKSGINIRKVLNKLNEIDFNIAKDRHAFGELYETILKELQSAGKSGEFYTPRAITEFICEMINPQLGEKILDPSCGTGGYLTAAIEHLKTQANNVKKRDYFTKYGEQARKVLETLLDKYADEGVTNIESMDILKVKPLTDYGSPLEIIKQFGSKSKYLEAVKELEQELYKTGA